MSSQLVTVTTPATASALTTLATLKLQLGIADSASDAALQSLIDRASSVIVNALGRSLARETVSETIRFTQRVSQRITSGRLEGPPIVLSRWPVVAVASVTASGTLLTVGTDYEADADAGLLYRLYGEARTWWTTPSVVVAYTAGYTLPGTVGYTLPGAIEDACISLIAGGWSLSGLNPGVKSEITEGVGRTDYFDRGFSTFTIDDAMAAQLAPYMARRF